VRVKQNSKIPQKEFYERTKELRPAVNKIGCILLSGQTETVPAED
jgi:hypothetical protein